MKVFAYLIVLSLFLSPLSVGAFNAQQNQQSAAGHGLINPYQNVSQKPDLQQIGNELYLAVEKGLKSVFMISKLVTVVAILLSLIHALMLLDILVSRFPYGVKLPWFFLVLMMPVGGPLLYLWSGCKLKIKGDPAA